MANYKFGINEPPHMRWPVAWYHPLVLLRSAKEMIASGDFIRNFDRRELYTEDLVIVDQAKTYEGDDFWWDFMSDSGDGGNASYTVARAMQSPTLPVTFAEGVAAEDIGESLPHSKLLVLGGDLAYPGASTEEYQYRFIEMWEAAKPSKEISDLTVVSIPQNHDWFDNISSFSRHFVGEYANHFLQAHTPQNRSYFVTRLPHDWWILGFDFALVGDLDRMQYEAFLNLFMEPENPTAETGSQKPIHEGHNVILLYPEPYWTRPLGDDAGAGYPKRYQRLEAQLLHKGIRIRMRLAGDLHHYVRESASEGAQLNYEDLLVTCGTGGAFLHPTHAKRVTKTKILDRIDDTAAMTTDLEKRVCVGLKKAKKLEPDQRQYTHKLSYPSRNMSKLLSCWNLLALFKPTSLFGLFADEAEGNFAQRGLQRAGELLRGLTKGNFMFPILLGALYFLAVYCVSFVFSHSFSADGFGPANELAKGEFHEFLPLWFKALFFSPLAFCVHLVLFALCGSIAHEDGGHAFSIGALYGLVHAVAAAWLFWLGSHHGYGPYVKGWIVLIGGIFVGGFLFGVYFTLVAVFGGLANNAFSAIAHQGYKGFLRFRIDKNGTLHGYMIGTDKIPQRWIKNPPGTYPLWREREDQDAPDWKVRDVFSLKK